MWFWEIGRFADGNMLFSAKIKRVKLNIQFNKKIKIDKKLEKIQTKCLTNKGGSVNIKSTKENT